MIELLDLGSCIASNNKRCPDFQLKSILEVLAEKSCIQDLKDAYELAKKNEIPTAPTISQTEAVDVIETVKPKIDSGNIRNNKCSACIHSARW